MLKQVAKFLVRQRIEERIARFDNTMRRTLLRTGALKYWLQPYEKILNNPALDIMIDYLTIRSPDFMEVTVDGEMITIDDFHTKRAYSFSSENMICGMCTFRKQTDLPCAHQLKAERFFERQIVKCGQAVDAQNSKFLQVISSINRKWLKQHTAQPIIGYTSISDDEDDDEIAVMTQLSAMSSSTAAMNYANIISIAKELAGAMRRADADTVMEVANTMRSMLDNFNAGKPATSQLVPSTSSQELAGELSDIELVDEPASLQSGDTNGQTSGNAVFAAIYARVILH